MRKVGIVDVSRAALGGDALRARALWQELEAQVPRASDIARPKDSDPDVTAFSASLAELFAERRGEEPPTWTKQVKPSARSHYLIKTNSDRKREWLRKLAPAALRRRNFYAPPNYLMSA